MQAGHTPSSRLGERDIIIFITSDMTYEPILSIEKQPHPKSFSHSFKNFSSYYTSFQASLLDGERKHLFIAD